MTPSEMTNEQLAELCEAAYYDRDGELLELIEKYGLSGDGQERFGAEVVSRLRASIPRPVVKVDTPTDEMVWEWDEFQWAWCKVVVNEHWRDGTKWLPLSALPEVKG